MAGFSLLQRCTSKIRDQQPESDGTTLVKEALHDLSRETGGGAGLGKFDYDRLKGQTLPSPLLLGEFLCCVAYAVYVKLL